MHANELSRILLEIFVNDFRLSLTNNCFDNFIDLLIKTIGKNGTLIFYSFNWNFFEGKIFDYKQTKSFSGAFSNAALKRKEFKRSKNQY